MSKSGSKKGGKKKSSSRKISKTKIKNSASSNSKKRIWKHQGRWVYFCLLIYKIQTFNKNMRYLYVKQKWNNK